MESLLQNIDVNKSETAPPVPAPRYKRKLIAQEDSRDILFNNQETCVNGKAVKIIPPPRRKNKVDYTVNKSTTTLLLVPSKEGNSTSVKKYQPCNENFLLGKNCSNARFKTKDTAVENIKTEPLLEEDLYHYNSLHKNVNIEDGFNITSSISYSFSKRPVTLLEPRECHIFESTAENRVLEASLEKTSNCSIRSLKDKFDQDYLMTENNEKNRVNSELSEHSATVVGVFYKPGVQLQNGELKNEEILFSPTQNKDFCSKNMLTSKLNCGNKALTVVPLSGCEKSCEKSLVKDSEENDSGVYFSDPKSPPHLEKVLKTISVNNSLLIKPNTDNSFEFYNHFSCNTSDMTDNNLSEEPGPQNYQMMLDYFEGQTVKSFREQTVSQFQLCSKEISKKRAIEDWLQIENDSLAKEESSFFVYSKSMIENDSRESLSPYPLSTVEEDNKSDSFSEYFEESKQADVFKEKKFVPETCAVSCTLDNLDKSRVIDVRNIVDFAFNASDVSIFPVNINDYNVNFDKNVINKCTIEAKQKSADHFNHIPSDISDDFDTLHLGLDQSLSEPKDTFLDFSHHLSVESEGSVNNVNSFSIPYTQPGVVNCLIAFFESVCKEVPPISRSSFSFEENIKKESIYKSTNELFSTTKSKGFTIDDFEQNTHMNSCENNEIFISKTNSIEHSDVIFNVMSPQEITSITDDSTEPETTYNHKELQKKGSASEYSTRMGFPCEEFGDHSTIQNNFFDLPFESEGWKIKESEVKSTECNSYNSPPNEICADDHLNSLREGDKKQDFKVDNNLNQYNLNSFSFDENSNDFYETKILEVSLCELSKDSEAHTMISDTVAHQKHKITRLPIIICSDSDSINTCPTEDAQLNPLEDDFQSNTGFTISVPEAPSHFDEVDNSSDVSFSKSISQNVNPTSDHSNDFSPKNSIDVVLEKNWGSVGIKLQADEYGVLVSDVSPGGAAGQNGCVFKGWVYNSMLKEEVEIFF